jgi:YD repeat-containing protein
LRIRSAETISYGNGIKTKADFLPGLARIRSLKSTTSQGRSVLDLNFVLDAFDNIESIEDHALKLTGLSSRFDFGYDEAHQLKSASGPYGSLAYDYDATGLMLGFEGTQFEHDPLNPLRPINQKNGSGQVIANFAYDADGNRIMKNDPIKGLKSFYEWDA